MYLWDFDSIWPYRHLFFNGLLISLVTAAAAIALGMVAGLFGAGARLSRFSTLRWIGWLYVEFFRCTPLLVQLVWFYYALPILTGIQMSAVTAAILALALYGGSFYGEIIRGGIASIDPGQREAGLALGQHPWKVMRRVILPQAIKRMIPALMGQSIIQFKNTSLVSIMAVPDLLYQSQRVVMDTYRPLEVYTTVALIYIVILVPMTAISKHYEKKLSDY